MKKIGVFLLCLCMCILPVKAETLNLAPSSGAMILMEASTRQVINGVNEQEKMYPASTTKIMSMILLFEAINSKKISFDDMVTTSAYAASMGGSQIYLEENEQMSVHDMFKSVAIGSANDCIVALGEYIAGTNDEFVKMMNEKAKELKLVNTHFANATGLHDDNHYTCALDLATMAAYLIEIGGDKLLETTSTVETYVREDTDKKFWLVNTNKLLNAYSGIDGLKTGYTKEAGYCLVATAQRDGLRLIGVVLKEPTPKQRNSEMAQVLDYGFNLYESRYVYHQGDLVTTLEVNDSEIKETSLYAKNDITYISKKGEAYEPSYNIRILKNQAPLFTNETVAMLDLHSEDGKVQSYDLVILEDIPKLKFSQKVIRDFQKMWQ